MAQYDGSIRINTDITTREAKKELKSLESRISKTAGQIASLRSKMDSLKDVQIPTSEYKKLQRELDSTIAKYTELDARVNDFKKIGMDVKSDAFRRTQDEAQELYMRIEDIRGAMFDLEESGKAFTLGRDTEKYAQMSVQLQRLNQKMESDTQRQSELQSALAAEEERLVQIRKNAVVSEHMIVEAAERRKQLLQEIADLEAAGVTQGYRDYDSRIQELAEIERKLKDYSSRTKEMAASYKQFGQSMRQLASRTGGMFSSLGDSIKRVDSGFKMLGERARNTFSRINKSAQKTSSIFSTMASRFKGLALSLLIFNQISKAFNAMTHAIRDGFKNLYEDNEKFKNSVDSLNASVLTLKNAFAAAFRPIVDIAVPYIQKLVEWLTHAVNLAGQFFAALTGRKTYTRAIKQTAKASEEAAEAAKEETDEMEKQLSPLDKLNNLTSENNKEKDKDKDDEGAGTGIMFEEVPIDSNILKMADRVKDILSKLFAPLKEAWNREGKFVMDSWKYALDEIWKLIKDIGRDFLEVWQQEKTVKIFEDLLHIFGDIGLVVGHLARNFRDAWNENKTGLHILENIRDIIGVIVHNIRLAADKTVEWADKLNFKPFLEAFERFTKSLVPLADALSGVLSDFYTQVLLPLGKWTIEEGLPKLLDVFTAFNEKVDWKALRDNLAEFWEHLEPFAETVGEGLILFIERISDALANFINSDAFENFLTMIEEWMDGVTPEDVANALTGIAEALIALKIALLGFSAVSAVVGVFATIKTFLGFIAEFGGLVANGAKLVAGGVSGIVASLGGILPALALVSAAVVGWDIGTWINEKLLGVDTPSFTEMMEGIKSSFTDGSWKEALNLWGEDIKWAWSEIWGYVKEDWENCYIGEMIGSFTDGSWQEALSLWGDDIYSAFVTLGERQEEVWDSILSTVKKKFEEVKDAAKEAFEWIADKVKDIAEKISGIGEKAKNIGSSFAKSPLLSARSPLLSGRSYSYSAEPYAAHPAIAKLSNIEIPKLATGAVLPANREFLALVGDQKHGTNVEAPLSTIKQALREEAISLGLIGKNETPEINLNLTVECAGYQLLHIMQKLDSEYFKQTGRHALA